MKGIKLFWDDLTHHGYKYKIGRNELQQEWNPNCNGSPGGFYYCSNICELMYFIAETHFWDVLRNQNVYFGIVESPPMDAEVSYSYGKYKTNILIIHELFTPKQYFENRLNELIDCAIIYPELLYHRDLKSTTEMINLAKHVLVNRKTLKWIPSHLITQDMIEYALKISSFEYNFVPNQHVF